MAARAECLLPDLPGWVVACLFDLDGVLIGPDDYEQYLDGKPRDDGTRSFLAGADVGVDDLGELVHGR